MTQARWARRLAPVVRAVVCLAIALVAGAVIIACAQHSVQAPFAAYVSMFRGAFGDANAWSNTLSRTMPLLLTGAAVYVGLAAGLFNIGAEGQMAVGALAAAVVGFQFRSTIPPSLLLTASLVGALAVGAFWAWLPAILKVKRGAHEVITAILLNYVAQNTTRYLATGPWRDPTGGAAQTPEVGAVLPRLTPNYDVHWGLVIAAAALALTAFALRSTVWGYRTRAVGSGPDAAATAGIRVGRTQIGAMLLSGALAGLAGAVLVLGAAPFRRFPADFYGAGYGFDGLAVALLAGGSPWAVFPSALLFGGLAAGSEQMAFDVGTPKQIVNVVQAILIVMVAARFVVRVRRPTVAGAAVPEATPVSSL